MAAKNNDVSEQKIESISDIVSIIQRPNAFLSDILEQGDENEFKTSPLGRADAGYPRPYPYGIWFRGQSGSSWPLEPAAFRRGTVERDEYYDERNMFHDLRLRTTTFDGANYSNFDLMCLMRHHTLPTRVIDWTENILVAAFFAIRGAFERYFNKANPNKIFDHAIKEDAAIFVINAHRLNSISTILNVSNSERYSAYNPGILLPDDLDVIARAALADHTYIDDAMQAMLYDPTPRRLDNRSARLVRVLQRVIINGHQQDEKGKRPKYNYQEDYEILKSKLTMPVGVMPKRAHPRMDAQLSVFTLHGGKMAYSEIFPDAPQNIRVDNTKPAELIEPPEGLEQIDAKERAKGDAGKPFLKKLLVSRFAIKRLMIELDRIGITEPMLFPEMDNQAGFVTRRWSVIGKERAIIDLPALQKDCKQNDTDIKDLETVNETLIRLYGQELAKQFSDS